MIMKGTFSAHRLLYVIVERETSRNRVFLRVSLKRPTNDRFHAGFQPITAVIHPHILRLRHLVACNMNVSYCILKAHVYTV
ncbi:hypothetical protein QX205_20135 [Acinetobacter pittii]|uniref:hypothetical protein n=1 Tax=Acinetobacter pittii TaxID=48296 RepID=UPI0025B61571|nr:hypothetical protein [Acinetobacter pittii]MDN4022366.1 hypothetical protein [Acinetobacter pittii]